MKHALLAFAALLLASVAIAGDAKNSIVLPDEFVSSATVMKVDQKAFVQSRTPMKFGAFQIVDHHAGWKSQRERTGSVLPPYIPLTIPVGPVERKWKQNFRFAVARDGKPQWGCMCRISGSSDGFSGKGVEVDTASGEDLECQLVRASNIDESWMILIHGHHGGVMAGANFDARGEATSGDARILIEPVFETKHPLPSWLHMPWGFTIQSNGETVAAVDFTMKPVVYVANSLNETDQSFYAAVASAILLYNRHHQP